MVDAALRALLAFDRELEAGRPWPRPICPSCGEGHVGFGAPTIIENGLSQNAHDHEAWEPEWVFGTFVTNGICENPGCMQSVIVTGKYRVDLASELDWDRPPVYTEYLRVEHFSPPLALLNLPEGAPSEVHAAVDRAGRLLYLDPGLAATALRGALEHYLTSEGVELTNAKGGFMRLDDRISVWRARTGNERVADLFLAVKWIGNDGTHGATASSVSDVLDGAGFIDEGFHQLFIAPAISAKALFINDARARARNGGKSPQSAPPS